MSDDLALQPIQALALAGKLADQLAAASVFSDYRLRQSRASLRRHGAALRAFALFLSERAHVSLSGEVLATRAEAWQGITFGLVDAFVKSMIVDGYAVGTINGRLAVLKSYARLAAQAGSIDDVDARRIERLRSYSGSQGRRMDEARAQAGLPARRGAKKAEARVLTNDQVDRLLSRPDTPQGRRDRLLLLLLVELGLRAGEAALAEVCGVDVVAGRITFYRPKVGKRQTHNLPERTWEILRRYVEEDSRPGRLLRGSRRNGELTDGAMGPRAIGARVRKLGREIGLEDLSPHDLRHTWATLAARAGTPVERLQDAGGWSSPSMPLRYIARAGIANQGLKLGEL